MGTIGTFGSFAQARLAIYSSQMGLSVTGNNIANINTDGYTRQKLDQESLRTGGTDRYQSSYSVRVGNGVITTGVSQLRDPYLDIRYRGEMSSVGAMDAKLGGLENIQAILDEVGNGEDGFGIVEAQLSDFYDALQQLSDQTGHSEYDIQVRSSAESLAKLFNSYASRLEEVYNNAEKAFHQDLATVNGLLTSIRDLNADIRKNEIYGDNALTLRDKRNQLIDQLSEYIKIDVTYEEENIGGGQSVDKLIIKLANANPDSTVATDCSTLVDGIYATQISVPETLPTLEPNENFSLLLSELRSDTGKILQGSTSVLLDDNDLYGALQAERELLTECGEFASEETIANVDENAATKRGIPYYQKALDLLANQVAATFNSANQGCIYNENQQYLKCSYNSDGSINVQGIFEFTYKDDNGDDATFILTKGTSWDAVPDAVKAQMAGQGDFDSIEAYVAKCGGLAPGSALFSNHGDSNDTSNITAANISISNAWANGSQIVSSFVLPTGMTNIPSSASDNVEHMIYQFFEKRDFVPGDVKADASDTAMFNGTFQEMWVNIGSVLGNDMHVTTTMLDTYHASSVELDTSRMAMSAVDLNDEAMNLMQYSQSYNAACRLMTTLDSVLDKLINGTGVTL